MFKYLATKLISPLIIFGLIIMLFLYLIYLTILTLATVFVSFFVNNDGIMEFYLKIINEYIPRPNVKTEEKK